MSKLHTRLTHKVNHLLSRQLSIEAYRRSQLKISAITINKCLRSGVHDIVFMCTHNSRRSHMSQIWAQAASCYYDLPFICYSGGTEATAFYKSGISAMKKAGFKILCEDESATNPKYEVSYARSAEPLQVFSKKFDDVINPDEKFIAVINCSRADESCPAISGAVSRIKMIYKDPKKSDGTPEELQVYETKCDEIGLEMFFLFSEVKRLYEHTQLESVY